MGTRGPTTTATIATAVARLEQAVSRRPDIGVTTHRAVTVAAEGLRCTTEEGPWTIPADLPEALGGSRSAPTPGTLVRAAVGSCMAMSYRLRAARHGIELRSVRVTVEADAALVGMLLCDADEPPGFSEVRYHVEVESDAPAADVRRVLDEGDRLSPLLDVLARANVVRRTVSIRPVGS